MGTVHGTHQALSLTSSILPNPNPGLPNPFTRTHGSLGWQVRSSVRAVSQLLCVFILPVTSVQVTKGGLIGCCLSKIYFIVSLHVCVFM